MGGSCLFHRELVNALLQAPVGKVNDGCGIDIDFAVADFKMQVCCRRPARIACESDNVAWENIIADFQEALGQVRVQSLDSIRVLDEYVVAVTALIVA